ncbi:MAG: type I DNA topoisomerase [Bacteroidales bacterium]|nr:type I DNA topoisomerase [Bacteroidales bacterium]MDD2425123.1 type I DNA topoisomerase [Bacteroidales bacterium]MDD3989456.1 type I DNA topoisomerase [Bacteroidales bacterium]
MGENLVIVESPAKAKTIEKFLGKDYSVKSSFGHIRDLSEKKLGIDTDNGYKPEYLISDNKKKVVSELKSLVKKADKVWLASDEDREGEAIAWHLKEVLELEEARTRRIVFHEITKDAILEAIKNPRDLDMNLVMAQQARRVLDRLVGFELSPVLWKKVKPRLSAGRVQSVAVRLIVDREREIRSFNSKSQFRIEAEFNPEGTKPTVKVTAALDEKFDTEERAENILKKCIGADFAIVSVEEKESKRTPPPPFTTSTLQQEASRKLGFSLNQTMKAAQNLYEAGFITYMRTDSTNLSKLAIGSAKQVITDLFGKEYSRPRQYATMTKGAQEAHEAIRPTYISNQEVDAGAAEKRLYTLIWKRCVASQMADADIIKTEIAIGTDRIKEQFIARADRVVFDGFLKLYTESSDEENSENSGEIRLPELKTGQAMYPLIIKATERFTQKPPRYTEASLVKKLEEMGIGRPSTYAPTISTILQRGYVIKESRPGQVREYRELRLESEKITRHSLKENWGAEKNKLFPEDIGILVNDFLIENFSSVIDYGFTAKVEEEFDSIAAGKLSWNKVIDKFYKPFHTIVETTLQQSRPAAMERVLGNDPKSGKIVSVRMGRFGPLAQIGGSDDPDKRFVSLAKGQLIETITLEEVLRLFELPRNIGEYKGSEVTAAIGRFGPYIRHAGNFVSLGKEDDPRTIELGRAIELIDAHQKKEADKVLLAFPEKGISVLNGRYGPYIKRGKENFRIPKGRDPKALTIEEITTIIEKGGKTKK